MKITELPEPQNCEITTEINRQEVAVGDTLTLHGKEWKVTSITVKCVEVIAKTQPENQQ
jgi:uncharacterized Zn finger protein